MPSKYAGGTSSLFDLPDAARGGGADDPVRGRIVLTEGFSMPASVGAFERRGAIGEIFIHPGKNVHEGICTSIWGAPTGESLGRKPAVPVVCINHPDGEALIADVQRGPVRASIKTWLREGWMRCLLPVVEIEGQQDPDEFLLVHGHYDSWYEGIGDNATGDAALLELARVLWNLRDRLKRTRADRVVAGPFHRPVCRFDLVRRHLRRRDRRALHRPARHRLARMRRCHGLRGSDVDGRGRRVVPIVDPGRAGPPLAQRVRPLRAGDYSFNQIGPTGLYMLLSNIPAEERQRRGYYAVGGCGGNIAWHTVDDLMPVADLEILRRDLMVYFTTIVRILNAPVHPFDYTAPLKEMADAVARYQEAAAGEIDLASVASDARQRRRGARDLATRRRPPRDPGAWR